MSLKNNLHYLSVSLSQFCHYFHHNVKGAAAGTAVAHVLSRVRIAQWVRNCRNYAAKRRNAPRTARFDGFVKHRNPSSIILYSILPTKRSTRDSTCATTVPAAAPRTTSINVDIQNLLKQILHTVHTDKNCRSIVQKCCRSRRKHTCHTKSNEP